MTREEMKTVFTKMGFQEEAIDRAQAKYDVEKISKIIDYSSNPAEAIIALHAFYPEFEVETLQEEMDFIQEQLDYTFKSDFSDEIIELSEKELSNISGGLSDWWNGLGKGWKIALIVGACFVGVAVAIGGYALVGAGAGAVGGFLKNCVTNF
ncbi:MAG: Blp family class II bacteriocin [Treponema sp.]|nr:Blp family class II bacteriocin [Treponema sp.]